MGTETNVRKALQEEGRHIQPNDQIRSRIMSQIHSSQQPNRKMKKRLLTVLIFISLLVPTAGLASYQMFITQLYETKEQFLSIGGTEEMYVEFESKLKEANAILTDEEFKEFMILLKDSIYYTEKMADSEGMLDESRLTETEKVSYDELMGKLTPFFEKINNGSSTNGYGTVEISTVLKQFPFKVQAPSYVPEGFSLELELGIIPPELDKKPYIQYIYATSNSDEKIVILVYENPSIIDKQTEDIVFEVQDGFGVLNVKVEESQTGFVVFIDAPIAEKEVEKIARSMIQ